MKETIQDLEKNAKTVIVSNILLIVVMFGAGLYLISTPYLTTVFLFMAMVPSTNINLARNQIKLLNRIDDLELDKLGSEKLFSRVDDLDTDQNG